MNNELVERIDHCLTHIALPLTAMHTLKDCKAALTQQQEAEPVAYISHTSEGDILGWERQFDAPSHTPLYPTPHPAAQPQVPDVDEIYTRFCAWCRKNKGFDLDPRLHTHSGGSVSAGGYISDRVTLIAFRAFRAGLLSATEEES